MFFPDLLTVPPILDFEASSLSDQSYPISVGMLVRGISYYYLIKPKREWTDWSMDSQGVHRLSRSNIENFGYPVTVVASLIEYTLKKYSCVYSDNPYYEEKWARKLNLEIEFRDARELLKSDQQEKLRSYATLIMKEKNLIHHCAVHDALALSYLIKNYGKIR